MNDPDLVAKDRPRSDSDSEIVGRSRYDNAILWDEKEMEKEINDFSSNRINHYLQPGVDRGAYDPDLVKEGDGSDA